MRIRTLALLGASAAILAAVPVAAQVVYDNGPINGTISGWTIWNFQYVTNSFTLSQTTTITGFTFGGWTSKGAQITALDYGFSQSPYGVVIGNTSVTAGPVVADSAFGGAYDVRNYTGSVDPITLDAGTYYFTLTNATTTDNNYAYWDINNGPSTVEANGVPGDGAYGPTSSDSFTLLGTAAVQPSVPEPASWMLMLGGFGMVGGALRARKRVSIRFA